MSACERSLDPKQFLSLQIRHMPTLEALLAIASKCGEPAGLAFLEKPAELRYGGVEHEV